MINVIWFWRTNEFDVKPFITVLYRHGLAFLGELSQRRQDISFVRGVRELLQSLLEPSPILVLCVPSSQS